jgi:hypothetical protein
MRRATRWTNLPDILDKLAALPLQCSCERNDKALERAWALWQREALDRR